MSTLCLLLLTLINALYLPTVQSDSGTCTIEANDCSTDTLCNQFDVDVSYYELKDPNDVSQGIQEAHSYLIEYQCLPSTFCDLLNDGCNYASFTKYAPFFAPEDCPDGTSSVSIPIKMETTYDCCKTDSCNTEFTNAAVSTSSTNCVENSDLSSVMEEVLECLAPGSILQYLQCTEDDWVTSCPDTLMQHLAGYPECACNVLCNQYGVDAADEFYVFSDLAEQSLSGVADYFAQCITDAASFDCVCEDNCVTNKKHTKTDCNEEEEEENEQDGGGYIYSNLQINICYLNQLRTDIWDYIKYGFNTEINKYDTFIEMELQSYIRRYGYNAGQNHGTVSIAGSADTECTLDSDVEIEIAIYYSDYDVLESVFYWLIELGSTLQNDFADDVLSISIEGDTLNVEGFGAVQLEYFEMILFDENGEQVDDVIFNPSGSPIHSVVGILMGVFANIVVQ